MFPPPPNNGFGLLRGDFPGAEELRVNKMILIVKFPALPERFLPRANSEFRFYLTFIKLSVRY